VKKKDPQPIDCRQPSSANHKSDRSLDYAASCESRRTVGLRHVIYFPSRRADRALQSGALRAPVNALRLKAGAASDATMFSQQRAARHGEHADQT
jgi:hypothetical protein